MPARLHWTAMEVGVDACVKFDDSKPNKPFLRYTTLSLSDGERTNSGVTDLMAAQGRNAILLFRPKNFYCKVHSFNAKPTHFSVSCTILIHTSGTTDTHF